MKLIDVIRAGDTGACELQEPQGTHGARRVFAEIPDQAVPDGATVETQMAFCGARSGRAPVSYATRRTGMNLVVPIPRRQPACVCFGGPELDLLFVTTPREHLDPAILQREPNAGDVFAYRTEFTGLPEEEYLS